MGIANHINRNAGKSLNFDSWKPRTLQRVQEDAQKWHSATMAKDRKWLYNRTGMHHSVLMELECWDPTIMVPIDGMHNFFLGLLQYHTQMVLGMDSARSWDAQASGRCKSDAIKYEFKFWSKSTEGGRAEGTLWRERHQCCWTVQSTS